MEFNIRYIDYRVDQWTLTKEIASILHSEGFWRHPDYDQRSDNFKPLNFQATLNPFLGGDVRSDRSGTLTVHSRKVGQELLRWQKHQDPMCIFGKKIKFYPKQKQCPKHSLLMTLEKTPFIDPDLDRNRHKKLQDLDGALRIDKVQFGIFYRPPASSTRSFSVEWEQSNDKCSGWLRFEYDHQLIRAELGDRMTENTKYSIVIQISNIVKCGVGYDFGSPYICFELLMPPILQEEDFNRRLSSDEKKDNKKFRRRIESLHPGHARVAPYAHQLRIILYDRADVEQFAKLCHIAGIRRPVGARIDAEARGFFSAKQLHRARTWLEGLDWPVAFQLEAILHNGCLNTEQLLIDLYDPINQLYRDNPGGASNVLRSFTEALQSSLPQETPKQCFNRIRMCKLKTALGMPSPGTFLCHHVTLTPTRMLLEGPYPTQSNRVIRRFPGYEDHFIRVAFRDEDKLHYRRWTQDVDDTSFLKDRVGGILKHGFTLAGRKFEFLAYSTSALRDHQVWFMNPFNYRRPGVDDVLKRIDSDIIRKSLGDFSGVIRFPSKYAARMAQAFTATDPSNVCITRDQWEEVPDLGVEPYLFTDGVGTISQELGDRIWAKLCESRRDHGTHAVKPSAYQIRFLGYKGVVGVDPELKGIKMRMRPSMNKFKGNEEDDPEIEIAQAFEHPSSSYLNQALVMVLEDLGVKADVFQGLQNRAVANAKMIDDSVEQFCQVLRTHSLGNAHRLSTTMQRLQILGLDLKHRSPEMTLDDPFLGRLRHITMNHVLREIKHKVRIPIPNAYMLVGVADEGPAYAAAGHENVYILPEGKVFVCIQKPDDKEPTWLKGPCAITRHPVVHPGDVQRAYAIGKPPSDQLCLFREMKNVVVFSSVGGRSLPSQLGGGDVDGDQFSVIFEKSLLPTEKEDPAEYPPGKPRELDRPGESTIEDICDFVVEYIQSDVVGLLSVRHLIIADQSKYGTRDSACLKLAEMCSQAVDYPKNGTAVNINNMPRSLILYKPDWHAAEVNSPRWTDYYQSSKALGKLYRAIKEDPSTPTTPQVTCPQHAPLTDSISMILRPLVRSQLRPYEDPDGCSPEIETLFKKYKHEMLYISMIHTLSNSAGARLTEEEIVVGTILAKCSQRGQWKDRIYRMHFHTSALVHDIQSELLPDGENHTTEDLWRAWQAWDFSLRNKDIFSANSFGLTALATVLDCLAKMGVL